MRRLLLISFVFTCLTWGAIPPAVMAEADLEKRSELALKAADDSLTAAAKAYKEAGEITAFRQHVADVQELTALCMKSLQESGKRASKRPKYFKRAELRLRGLLRRMTSLAHDVSAEDRPLVESAQKSMSDIHDQLLHEIMSKK